MSYVNPSICRRRVFSIQYTLTPATRCDPGAAWARRTPSPGSGLGPEWPPGAGAGGGGGARRPRPADVPRRRRHVGLMSCAGRCAVAWGEFQRTEPERAAGMSAAAGGSRSDAPRPARASRSPRRLGSRHTSHVFRQGMRAAPACGGHVASRGPARPRPSHEPGGGPPPPPRGRRAIDFRVQKTRRIIHVDGRGGRRPR